MTADTMPASASQDGEPERASGALLLGRLCVGLAQGLLLYWLSRMAGPESPLVLAGWFAPLMLVAQLIPPIIVVGATQMRPVRLVVWCAAIGTVVAGLGYHSTWRLMSDAQAGAWGPVLPAGAILLTAAFVFVAYALVAAGESAGTWRAPYAAYFRISWKLMLQLGLAALFAGVLYGVLWLGAGMFQTLGIDFLVKLLVQPGFVLPVTGVAFAAGLHVTDVRDGFIEGVRTLVLTLLSWILPLLVVLVAGFLLTLLVKGLAPLWATRWAATLLLGVAATTVVLINAVYKSGLGEGALPALLRRATYVACLTLAPLVGIATYALGLRIGQYGLTERRVLVAAALVVALCYAIGYGWAALERRGGLRRIASTNVVAAWITLAVFVALYTPIADPARLSVGHQVARLKAGKVTPDQFDFQYLARHSGRYGRDALANLRAEASGPGADRLPKAAEILALTTPEALDRLPESVFDDASPMDAAQRARNLTMRTPGGKLPQSLLEQDWPSVSAHVFAPRCLRDKAAPCDAYIARLGSGRGPGVLIVESLRSAGVLLEQPAGDASAPWRVTARFRIPFGCEGKLADALARGAYSPIAPTVPDIAIDGQRLHLQAVGEGELSCGAAP